MAEILWLLFGTTNGILFILCTISLKQCCNVDVYEKQRCHRAMSVLLFSICTLILNSFYYLSSIYQLITLTLHGLELELLTFIFEPIVTMIGFHIFCLFHVSFINRLHHVTKIGSRSWVSYIFKASEIFVFTQLIACYSCAFIFYKYVPIIIFYINYAVVILCQSLLTLYESNKILKLLNLSRRPSIECTESDENTLYNHHRTASGHSMLIKLASAKRSMRVVIFVLILICFACVGDIVLNLQMIRRDTNGSLDAILWSNVMRSSLMITFMLILVFWIYDEAARWCSCDPNSVCVFLSGCVIYTNYADVMDSDRISSRKHDDKHMPFLNTPTGFRNLTMNTYTCTHPTADTTTVGTPVTGTTTLIMAHSLS
eukprot:4834_1